MFPWGNDLKWFDDWIQDILQDSTLKNRQSWKDSSPVCMVCPSTLFAKRAQCKIYYYLQFQCLLPFLFFFSLLLSTFSNRTSVLKAEEEAEMQAVTYCVQSSVTFCQHNKVQQSEGLKTPLPETLRLLRLNGLKMYINSWTWTLLL